MNTIKLLTISVCLALTACANLPSSTMDRPALWATIERQSLRDVDHSPWVEWQPSLQPLMHAAIQKHPDALTTMSTWQTWYLQEQNIEKSTFPVLNLTSNASYNDMNKSTTSTGALQLSGIIDVFGKVALAKKEGTWNRQMAESLYYQAVQNVTRLVIKKAVQAHYQKQAIEILKQQMDIANERAQISQNAFQAGFITEQSLNNAWAAHNTAINNYDQAVQAYQSSCDQLLLWTKLPLATIEESVRNVDINKMIDMPNLNGEHLAHRMDVQAAIANAEATTYARMGYERERYPTISITGSWSSQTIQSGMTVDNHGFTVGPFSISIPLWDNGIIARKVLDGQSKEYVAWKKVEDAIMSSMVEHRHNLLVLQTLRIQNDRERTLLLLNQEQQKEVEQQWKVGKISRLDMLNTITNHKTTELQYINTSANLWMHYADYMYGLGVIL